MPTREKIISRVAIGAVFLISIRTNFAQNPPATMVAPSSQATGPQAVSPGATSPDALIAEAAANNPQVLAARNAWRAATYVPSQVATLPDPQVMVQHFSVGSPRPFAGYTNSDFAYIGLGISQDIPYPGKLKLKGEVAKEDAAAAQEHYEAVRRAVLQQLKTAYFKLSYEMQEIDLLERDGKLLEQIANIAEAHYRVGQGNQQDVLRAQLERTKLLRETAVHHQEHFSLQAQLRQILNRPSDSPDIVPEPITESPLNYTVDELLTMVRTQNPDVRGQQDMIRKQSLQVELARKDFYPDFNVQYMWQRTDPAQYRAYYMLTFGARIPIYHSRRQLPELEQATEELNSSRREYEAQVQQSYFDIRDQYLQAETDSQILKMYREGLIPQAAGTYRAGLASYESNRQDFLTLLSSFLDVLRLDEEYWRTLLDHETALARIEQMTGASLNGKTEVQR